MRSVILEAVVLEVDCQTLLVRDLCTGQEILVHTRRARRFDEGDLVCIRFNGAMTMSIPPQITAICIRRLSRRSCGCGRDCGC